MPHIHTYIWASLPVQTCFGSIEKRNYLICNKITRFCHILPDIPFTKENGHSLNFSSIHKEMLDLYTAHIYLCYHQTKNKRHEKIYLYSILHLHDSWLCPIDCCCLVNCCSCILCLCRILCSCYFLCCDYDALSPKTKTKKNKIKNN